MVEEEARKERQNKEKRSQKCAAYFEQSHKQTQRDVFTQLETHPITSGRPETSEKLA
jgi:hypothetical protein